MDRKHSLSVAINALLCLWQLLIGGMEVCQPKSWAVPANSDFIILSI